jgi:hypothetical protein
LVKASRRSRPATNQHRTGNDAGRIPWHILPLIALIGVSCWTSPVAAASLTVQDLLVHGERYHQQPVSLTGTASGLKILAGPRDLPFYTFSLRDTLESADEVTVIMRGKPEVAEGDEVFVHGIFIKARKAGRSTVTNRIEATIVEPLRDQRNPFVG